jgi:glycosyltransferase involved in cell wall biosynthesis
VTRVLLDARKARDFGIGRYVLGLLAGLARRGEFELSAAVLPGDETLLPPGVSPVVCAAGHYTLRELLAVRSVLRRVRPDLFHAPHYVVPLSPPAATVVTLHDLMHLHRPEHGSLVRRTYARTMIRRAARLAARVIAVSEATRRELIALLPSIAGRAVTIPNGVDRRFFEGGRGTPSPASRGKYLLFLGNDKPHKNLENLLGAFVSLRREMPELELLLAGVAPSRPGPPGARALGFVPDAAVAPLLAGACALVLPSFAEGFGLPVAEAMAAGTPVACSDLPALRETAGEAALYFDPHDVASIARTVGTLLDDEATRERLRNFGRDRAASLTWDAAAERTSALYREVLAEVARGSGGTEKPPGS